ncbi:hypothetical protein DL96DRAFT_1616540 [Flagelloscypha sp. PMI_526]|nr:hypothetical protein DL96DRAFT_1616540 [Flagelloscypha sp. PMI_526]
MAQCLSTTFATYISRLGRVLSSQASSLRLTSPTTANHHHTPINEMGRPTKQVHWDDSIPVTPSPAYSVSTLPSSPGIATPPMYQLHASLPPPSPNTIGSPMPVIIHPILGVSAIPALSWDVSKPLASLVPLDKNMPQVVLAEPATNPGFTTLRLSISGIPWCINVASLTPVITIYDVLKAIERFMKTPVTAAEYQSIPTNAQREAVSRAFTARHGGDATVKHEGLKRVDWLCGRYRFLGLKTTGKSGLEWELCLQ